MSFARPPFRFPISACIALLALIVVMSSASSVTAANYTLVGWNNLGMHCMDGDYSVSALLPPYNTIHAQLIDPQGHLVRDSAGISVTYEAVADPDGSINTTSQGKTNFWDHVQALFGAALTVDQGLAGHDMPGASNLPQPMTFDAAAGWFIAEGIPLTPYDDAHNKNTYPLMRLAARDSGGSVLATTDIVLPVSDEMDCKSCHASGSDPAAVPYEGWVNDSDPQRDMRLNILRLHDDKDGTTNAYQTALAAAGYNPAGLFATATTDGTAVLCARCHLSEALAGSGLPGVEPLTQAVHRRMANVVDPNTGLTLGASDNRSACYRCHPGSVTRCLRGVMGASVAADGTLAIQCQSCHGSMLDVGSPQRTGWLNEPVCQSCHTGTATSNNGQLRYTSVFESPGQVRIAADQTYATTPDAPASGFSLYRFSTGHGGLKCESCHGPTHAEFPSTQRNDNLQSIALQGHVGTLAECDSCHQSQPATVNGGPHGMHPVGQAWVSRHSDAVGEDGGGSTAQCQACHGADYRGTVLSRAQADRTLVTESGSKQLWRGFQVGCYTCHQGPGNSDTNPNRPAVVEDAALATSADTSANITLVGTDSDGDDLTMRIVTQPAHGTVGLNGNTAQYFPEPGFSGHDEFTFAAWDGSTDSNLGRITVAVVAAGGCVGDCNGDGTVTVDEVLTMVNIALGNTAVQSCSAGDANADGLITVDEILAAGNNALNGCNPGPTLTPTGAATATIPGATATAAVASATATATATQVQPPTPTPFPAVPTVSPTANPNATLANIQANIFTPTCAVQFCHTSFDQAGNLVLESGLSHDQLVGMQCTNSAARTAGLLRVTAGNPDLSFLITKLTLAKAFDPNFGSRMPLSGAVTAEQIQLIRDWITAGALP